MLEAPQSRADAKRGPALAPERRERTGKIDRWRVLVVDDDDDTAWTLARVIEHKGHDVRTATDGESALEVAKSFQPEVAVLDIVMPGIDGYEVCRRLRATLKGRNMVIAAYTGFGETEDRLRACEAGFDIHMVKAYDPRDLLAWIARAVALQRARMNPDHAKRGIDRQRELIAKMARSRPRTPQAERLLQRLVDTRKVTRRSVEILDSQHARPSDLSHDADAAKGPLADATADVLEQLSVVDELIRRQGSATWIRHGLIQVRSTMQSLEHHVKQIPDATTRDAFIVRLQFIGRYISALQSVVCGSLPR